MGLAGAARSVILTPPPFLILLYTPKRGRACNTLCVGKWQARVPAVSRRVPATHYARANVCLQTDAVCLQHTMRDQTCACRLTPCACNALYAIKRACSLASCTCNTLFMGNTHMSIKVDSPRHAMRVHLAHTHVPAAHYLRANRARQLRLTRPGPHRVFLRRTMCVRLRAPQLPRRRLPRRAMRVAAAAAAPHACHVHVVCLQRSVCGQHASIN